MPVRQPPSVLGYEAVEHTARNDRLTVGAAFSADYWPLSGRSGALVGPPDGAGEVSLPDQATVRVQAGIFVVQGQVDAAQGQYVVINDGILDKPIEVTQHASQYRRVTVLVGVLDSVMAGIDPDPVLDDNGDPVLDADGNPTVAFGTDTNYADVFLVAGALSPTSPGLPPDITPEDYQGYAVLGWVNVPPAGQALTYTRNGGAIGSRTGITPVVSGDNDDGRFLYEYRHAPAGGLEVWNGSAWQSIYTAELTASRVRITSGTDASASSTGHGLQVGSTAGANVVIDTNEVMARKAGAVQPLYLGRAALGGEGAWDLTKTSTPDEALVTKGYLASSLSRTTAATLRLTSSGDATPTSTTHGLQIGESDEANLRLDTNEIVASNDGQLDDLYLTRPRASGESWNLASSGTPTSAFVTKAYVAPALDDTGWVSFTPAGGGWAVVSGDGGARYRVKAGIFYMRFAATRASWGGGADVVTLADRFLPAYDQTATGHWGGNGISFEVAVHADTGKVEMAFGGNGGVYLSASWPID